MRTLLTLVLVAFALVATGAPAPADLVPPYVAVMVRCTDPAEALGYHEYEVDMVNGGIDHPMTWSLPGTGTARGRLVNAWRLRLGHGNAVITSEGCSYFLPAGSAN